MFKTVEHMSGQGKTIEHEVLGSIEKRRYPEWEQYRGYEKSIDIVKETQPIKSSPSDPETRFANDLHATIAEEIGIDYQYLKFFTAVGSQLDSFHGVDAFFEIEDPKSGATERVTLDVTINPSKDEHKADVIILMPEEGLDPKLPEDKKAYTDKLEETANDIMKKFKAKITN